MHCGQETETKVVWQHLKVHLLESVLIVKHKNSSSLSKVHNSIRTGQNKIQKPNAQLHIIRKQSTKFQINPKIDER